MFLVHMYNVTRDDSLSLVHVYGCTVLTLVPEVIAYTRTITSYIVFLHPIHAKVMDLSPKSQIWVLFSTCLVSLSILSSILLPFPPLQKI